MHSLFISNQSNPKFEPTSFPVHFGNWVTRYWAVYDDDLTIQSSEVLHWPNKGWSKDVETSGMINYLNAILSYTLVRPTVFNGDTGYVNVAIDSPLVADVITYSDMVSFRNCKSVHQPRNLRQGVAGG
ncbi:hypothetical protein TNCT_516131 [Trichonephila clavata]|uniref:Uncharacterized protein n=1 Tax=Trichonephila clavata TaxID=2740835 RepID=A0A8X6HYK4_TRICU|nr:hypothetical protein TNCT_516131 [Trichonephila clavata]